MIPAISTNCFPSVPLGDALNSIREDIGCKYVEISSDTPHKHAQELFRSAVHPNTFVRDYGVHCVGVGGGWCDFVWGETDELDWQMELATSLGHVPIRLFIVNPKNKETAYSDEQMETAIKRLRILADLYKAKQMHSVMCIENHGAPITTAAQMAIIVDRIGRENVRTTYDHANYGNPKQMGSVWPLAHRIGQVHVKDIDGQGHVVRLDEGAVRWPLIIRWLHFIKYKGAIVLEHAVGTTHEDHIEAAKHSFEVLKHLIKEES
jgi:sugar phosphate isomerase/epimerase